MSRLLVGCGGWAYFKVPGLKSLDAYARAFDFVEVNSTFYELPTLQTVKSWRRRVPPDFEFSVRCHKDVTHKYQLEPEEGAFQVFQAAIEICSALNSEFLVLETPSSMGFSDEKILSIRNFLRSVDTKGVRLVWETRRRDGEPIPARLTALMRDNNIVHCVDLSKETPAVESDTVYTRVFGKGQHNIYQFTDEELEEIDTKMTRTKASTEAVSFHNVRMYKDAARFKTYKQTGEFPPVTRAKGQQALGEVLREDAKFPATKQELIKNQGWKVIDLAEDRRVHAATLLEKLPDERFRSIEEVLTSLPQA